MIMKHNKLLLPILLILLFAATGGCSGDSKDKDNDISTGYFYKLFIGRWQQVDCGGKEIPPSDFPFYATNGHILEFFEGGILLNSIMDQRREYRIDSAFVYYDGGKSPNGHTYRYTFTGLDTLRLDHVEGMTSLERYPVTYNVYKRLK
jgi:hypothetical protein